MSENTSLLKPSLDVYCYLLAQLCLAKKIASVQLSSQIKKCNVLVTVRLLPGENKALPFYWMVFLNLSDLASYILNNVLLRQNINPYGFHKVH